MLGQALNHNEVLILRELRKPYHSGWQNSVEVADYTELPVYLVRAALNSLSNRGLVQRGREGHWGDFALTEIGLQELCAADQLRLVPNDAA